MTVRLVSAAAADVAADALILVAHRSDGELRILCPAGSLPAADCGAVAAAALDVDRTITDPVRLPGSLIGRSGVVVVSPVAEIAPEPVRRAVGAAIRSLAGRQTPAVVAPSGAAELLRACAEGAGLGAYRFDRYRGSDPTGAAPKRLSVVLPGRITRDQRAVVRQANSLVAAVGLARDLVNTPPNDLGPADMAHAAATTFEGTSVTVKVWDDRALRRGGYGGLTAVGQGSARGPRLIRLSYRHDRARHTVALVGKGITFDSGGLSLKPAKAMETMKSDMGGAAAVLATIRAVADARLPVNVTGWLATAENMPSGTAQRPGDVIRIRGGTSVEVLNTDAEGRLVLADGLVAAAAEDPDVIVDIATLTGAQLIALGSRVAGVMGTDEALRDEILAAAGGAGESVWPMPLPDELRPSLESTVADIANIGERNGGMLTAALFLREFVPEATPWAHLDIAGPAFNEGAPHGYTGRGGTGFGVRTLVEFLARRSRH